MNGRQPSLILRKEINGGRVGAGTASAHLDFVINSLLESFLTSLR